MDKSKMTNEEIFAIESEEVKKQLRPEIVKKTKSKEKAKSKNEDKETKSKGKEEK